MEKGIAKGLWIALGFVGTRLYKNNLETYVASRSMTMSTKVRIMSMVTLVMAIGYSMMSRVPAARVVLVFVWIFHVLYFVFGVKTLRAVDGTVSTDRCGIFQRPVTAKRSATE